MDPEFILDIAPLVVVSGLIGARAYYVLAPVRLLHRSPFGDHQHSPRRDDDPRRDCGRGIDAGVFVYRRRDSLLRWCDVIVPGLAAAQAIGRWGNWANQEAFGTPSDLPWAVEISPRHRPDEYPDAATFHPTFLYESIANVLIAAGLCWIVLRIADRPPPARRRRALDLPDCLRNGPVLHRANQDGQPLHRSPTCRVLDQFRTDRHRCGRSDLWAIRMGLARSSRPEPSDLVRAGPILRRTRARDASGKLRGSCAHAAGGTARSR